MLLLGTGLVDVPPVGDIWRVILVGVEKRVCACARLGPPHVEISSSNPTAVDCFSLADGWAVDCSRQVKWLPHWLWSWRSVYPFFFPNSSLMIKEAAWRPRAVMFLAPWIVLVLGHAQSVLPCGDTQCASAIFNFRSMKHLSHRSLYTILSFKNSRKTFREKPRRITQSNKRQGKGIYAISLCALLIYMHENKNRQLSFTSSHLLVICFTHPSSHHHTRDE